MAREISSSIFPLRIFSAFSALAVSSSIALDKLLSPSVNPVIASIGCWSGYSLWMSWLCSPENVAVTILAKYVTSGSSVNSAFIGFSFPRVNSTFTSTICHHLLVCWKSEFPFAGLFQKFSLAVYCSPVPNARKNRVQR